MRIFTLVKNITITFTSSSVLLEKNRRFGGLSTKSLLSLFLILFTQITIFGQNGGGEYKIDPVFRYVIAASKSKTIDENNGVNNFAKRVTPTKGFALPAAGVEERYECIVHTRNARSLNDNGIIISSALPTFATAWVTLNQIVEMAAMPQVTYIEAPQILHKVNDIVVASSGASLLHQKRLNNTVYKGKNVLVAIFDSGIDWKHPDFRSPDDTTKSRILRIWDQTITAGTGEAPPSGFNYGVEYTQTQINNEIDGTPANFVKEKDTDAHGTHVAGTAVGNGRAKTLAKYAGVAPEADIIVIKGGDSTFLDTRVIDALTYLKTVATTLGKPVVLNLSVGSLFGPHDGTRPMEIAIDNFTKSAAGRAVTVAAGNDGGSNRHNQFNLGSNQSASVSFTVPAVTSGSDVFSYRVFANTNGSVNATVVTPGNGTVTANSGQTVNRDVLSNNFTVIITNGIDPSNNNSYVDVSLTRNGSNSASPEGNYALTITNTSSSAIRFDGWIYKLNKSHQPTVLINGDNNYLVTSPGNASTAITVASYVGRNAWNTATNVARAYQRDREDSISSFSARGPRRDNVLKPEITANGQGVISSLSSDASGIDTSFVIEKGLYHLKQGTSMAAPAVAGSVALLFQANTAATNAEIRNLITSNATKDVMTELAGPTPNSTWGHGKLDVFRAASALFNCVPADRKTFKYDSSTRNSEQAGFRLTTERVGVRFTPNISGKLGGVYCQTIGSATGLIVEVRTNNSGNPGTLLGTMTIPSEQILKYSWNYFDISILNISVTAGTDYFVVIYRNPGSTQDWTIGAERLAVDNRSIVSQNNGTSWTVVSSDLKIRSVVYNNKQISGALATINSADTRNIISSNQFINSNCQLIAQVVADGLNPVTGNITSKVWLEGAVPRFNSNPFVQRHYEITPVAGTTFTGRVTLYFTQAEFTAFNSDPASILDLPANPGDVTGKANLRIFRLAGASSNNTGLPATYTGAQTLIDPADGDIVWNTEANRWEVTFDVTGFGGYIVQTNTASLPNPTIITYFNGNTQGLANVLNWKVNCTNTTTTFFIERSSDGVAFNNIETVTTTASRCLQPFTFTDPSPLPGMNYYRLKIADNTGSISYSDVILLQISGQFITRLYPNLISRGSSVTVSNTGLKGSLVVHDALGRRVLNRTLITGVQNINLRLPSTGIYFYIIRDGSEVLLSGKIIVQ